MLGQFGFYHKDVNEQGHSAHPHNRVDTVRNPGAIGLCQSSTDKGMVEGEGKNIERTHLKLTSIWVPILILRDNQTKCYTEKRATTKLGGLGFLDTQNFLSHNLTIPPQPPLTHFLALIYNLQPLLFRVNIGKKWKQKTCKGNLCQNDKVGSHPVTTSGKCGSAKGFP